jgi:acyl-coenzyme A thioesterase PaaI-like protein
LDGGIVAMLLDAAMTECLLQQGVAGVTGRLTIGYGEPVLVGVPAVVRARVAESRGVLHRVEAEIEQDGQSKVRGEGKFVPHPDAR